MIKYTLIYGVNGGTPMLLEAARLAALKAWRMATANNGVIVLDRYGIEQEVMNVCENFEIPLLVIGTTTRPRSGIRMKFYERAILPMKEYQDREAQLRRYALNKANGLIVIGDSADCRAMRVYARTLKKAARHTPELAYNVPAAPDSDWLKAFGYFNIV